MINALTKFGEIFIPYPYIALIPAIIFGFLFFKLRKKMIGITAILWLLYSIWEISLFMTCSGDCNIRVDLLLIYPLLIIFTVIALIQTGRKFLVTTP